MRQYKNCREMFEKEWFPKAYAIGISWNEFWQLNPHIINLMQEGHQEKLNQIDELMWWLGIYIESAVTTSIEHNLAGRKAKSKYIEEPILQQVEKEKNMSEKELQKQRELFVAKLEIMKTNFELSHPKKQGQ